MKKAYLFLIILFILLPVHSMTLLVDTVVNEGQEQWEDWEIQSLRSMENGLIDSAFELGHILFNSQTTGIILEDEDYQIPHSLRSLGADYLIRIQADFIEMKMVYQLYSVRDNLMVISGEWQIEDIGNPDEKGYAELYFIGGELTMNLLSEYL